MKTLLVYVVGHAMLHEGSEAPGVPLAQLSTGEFTHIDAMTAALPHASVEAEFAFGLEAVIQGLACRAEH